MRRIHFNAALIAALAALLMLTACGRSNQEAESTPPSALRTPIPTFTPTASINESASESSIAPANVPEANTSPAEGEANASVPEANLAAAPAPEVAVQPNPPAAASTAPGVGGPLEPPAVVAPLQPALGVVNTQLVNSRSGPDTTYDVVMVLGAGENYDITGKNGDGTWVRICCVQQQEAWTMAEFLNITGSLEALPVAQAGETSGQTVTRSAAAAQATLTSAPASAQSSEAPAEAAAPQAAAEAPAEQASAPAEVAQAPVEAANTMAAGTAEAITAEEAAANVAAAEVAGGLQLAGQEQFPETNVVRVFLFVYQGTDALEGYTLRVVKDGAEQSVSATSFGGRPGMTWPIADDRQRFQNLKAEFPGVSAAGTWEITPMKDGAPAGPSATFTLAEGDPNQELYVRYVQP